MNTFSRRNFLKVSGLAGTSLCLGVALPAMRGLARIVQPGENPTDVELNAWISINTTGKVTLFSHRAEMGQGVFQAIPQILAEELEVLLEEVDVAFTPGDNKKYGNQVTGGSSTVRDNYKNLLRLGATAREMLVEAAAKRWNAPKTDCFAEAGKVVHRPTGKQLHYGELVQEAAKLPVPQDVPLKPRSAYKLVGKPLRRKDTPLKTNGSAVFGIDHKVPGMLYAVVERCPRLRGTVKAYDDTDALKVPGVKRVLKVQMKVFQTIREGVAVVADSTWAAMQGRKALRVTWDDNGFEHIDTDAVYKQHRENLKNREGLMLKKAGDPDGVLKKTKTRVDAVYETPYQAHYCMEPLNCVAHFQGDRLDIWGPIQGPDWVQDFLSEEFGLKRENVHVNMTFLGGAFGRKAFLDYPHEAALLSKAVGAPVQVVWTREDDALQGPFRPGMSYRCEGAVENGRITAIRIRATGQNIGHLDGSDKSKPNESITEGFPQPYFTSIPNHSFSDVVFETPVPVMWWRSVYASTNAFAFESFFDELAAKAGVDPLDLRRSHLPDERMQAVLDKLAETSGWRSRKPKSGYGMAFSESFGSLVGEVVKVSRGNDGKVNIDKVWVVIDCGWYVNPDTIRAQVEGSVVMALGAAAMHEIRFKDGMAQQPNFSSYPMPRINNVPPVEVHIMENHHDAGGVGEPALPPFAAALTNAVYDLTGKRIRKLPFDLNAL